MEERNRNPSSKNFKPTELDELRLISLTKFISKTFEHFIFEWLLEIVGPQLDPGQFGGIKGNSTTHYLIHLVNFILANLENRAPTAVLAVITDFKKAFNRMSHLKVMIVMHEMGFPGWLLKIMGFYLSNRSMLVRYQGSISKECSMPGGAPQGTVLGVLAFILQMNKMGTVPIIPKETFLTPPGQKQDLTSVSYTHLTLPTTPYV